MKLKPPAIPGKRRAIFPIGIVTAIDLARCQIVVRTDPGTKIEILFDAQTMFHRVEPGAKNLKGARLIHVSDIAIGDRILVRAFTVNNRMTFLVRSVFVRANGASETRGGQSERTRD